jgi:hypothetical protein
MSEAVAHEDHGVEHETAHVPHHAGEHGTPDAHGHGARGGTAGAAPLWFRPVHPLNYNLRELLAEREQPSEHWPGVTQYVMAHIDNQNMLAVLVGFRPGTDPGHIDNVRCFRAILGRAADYPDPLAALGPLAAVVAECEAQFGDVLDKLFGKGLPRPGIAPVTRDPAAAHIWEG